MLEVGDGCAFAQKLGVGCDSELSVRAPLGDDALHLVAGADRHGRFGDDHLVAVEHRGDVLRGLEHVGEIGVAVAAPRGRADGDEHRLRCLDRAGKVGREGQPVLAHVLGDQLRQAGLEDRHLAALQRRNLVGVVVDAGHGVAEVGKAGPRHKADISGSDHCHAHELFLLGCWYRSQSTQSKSRLMCRHGVRPARAEHPYAESQKDSDLLFVALPAYPGRKAFPGFTAGGPRIMMCGRLNWGRKRLHGRMRGWPWRAGSRWHERSELWRLGASRAK